MKDKNKHFSNDRKQRKEKKRKILLIKKLTKITETLIDASQTDSISTI